MKAPELLKHDPPLKVGDVVRIRGDLRWNHNMRRCQYHPGQLVDGKYLRHTGTGLPWEAPITRIVNEVLGDYATIGGMSMHTGLLEKVEVNNESNNQADAGGH